jgi:hypothetical protein
MGRMPPPSPAPLESALVATFDALPDQLAGTIRDRIDPAWIEQALAKGEGVSVRRRKMPADVVVWNTARRLRDTAGKTDFVILTSMTDAARFPAIEVAALYHRRWETEFVVNELKTRQRGARMTLRSKTPAGVHQELFALMLAHNLTRMEMAEVGSLLGVEPTRISFHRAVAAIAHHLHNAAAAPPSKLLMYRDLLGAELAYFLLPERRTERSYPRALKVVVPRYPRKVIAQPRGSS